MIQIIVSCDHRSDSGRCDNELVLIPVHGSDEEMSLKGLGDYGWVVKPLGEFCAEHNPEVAT